MDVDPLTETTDFDAVRDNRDCRVLLSWDPPDRYAQYSTVHLACR